MKLVGATALFLSKLVFSSCDKQEVDSNGKNCIKWTNMNPNWDFVPQEASENYCVEYPNINKDDRWCYVIDDEMPVKSDCGKCSESTENESGNENKYSSTCNDDGMLEINIPFANEATSVLLRADAGDCFGLSGVGGNDQKHEYSYNTERKQAVLKIDIEKCNLAKDLKFKDPVLRVGDGSYHFATANVTIGAIDSGRELIFYNAVLGAECGTQTEYTVKFDYSGKIETQPQDGCHDQSPQGQCIVPAFDVFDFSIKEYDEGFKDEVNNDPTVKHKANEMIHLKIESSNLPSDKIFSVKSCKFVDEVVQTIKFDEKVEYVSTFENYTMFDAKQSCDNKYIDLKVGYAENEIQISHRLFLLTKGDQDSYSLECQIKVCDKSDANSECASLKKCDGSAAGSKLEPCDKQTKAKDGRACLTWSKFGYQDFDGYYENYCDQQKLDEKEEKLERWCIVDFEGSSAKCGEQGIDCTMIDRTAP